VVGGGGGGGGGVLGGGGGGWWGGGDFKGEKIGVGKEQGSLGKKRQKWCRQLSLKQMWKVGKPYNNERKDVAKVVLENSCESENRKQWAELTLCAHCYRNHAVEGGGGGSSKKRRTEHSNWGGKKLGDFLKEQQFEVLCHETIFDQKAREKGGGLEQRRSITEKGLIGSRRKPPYQGNLSQPTLS